MSDKIKELCDDAISRDAALSAISSHFLLEEDKDRTTYEMAYEDGIKTAYDDVYKLPYVKPVQKTGRWERVVDKSDHLVWECTACGWQQRFATKYCPDCGLKMAD